MLSRSERQRREEENNLSQEIEAEIRRVISWKEPSAAKEIYFFESGRLHLISPTGWRQVRDETEIARYLPDPGPEWRLAEVAEE